MTQELVVLCCAHCGTYQTHISKKATKWNCKVCDHKQSIKQFFGRGTGKQCRHIVQQLNMNRNGVTSDGCNGVVNDDDYKLLQQLSAVDDACDHLSDVKKMRLNTDERNTCFADAIKAEKSVAEQKISVNVVQSKWNRFL